MEISIGLFIFKTKFKHINMPKIKLIILNDCISNITVELSKLGGKNLAMSI